MDSSPSAVHMRGVAYFQNENFVWQMLAPLVVALLAGVLGYTWRGVFVGSGFFTLVCVLMCLRLRDPGFGRWDTQRIRATARDQQTTSAADSIEDVELGF